jgi:hypothetical protein
VKKAISSILFHTCINPAITISRKRAMDCEFCVAYPPNSSVVVYRPIAMILGNFWSSEHLWNWAKGKSSGEYRD